MNWRETCDHMKSSHRLTYLTYFVSKNNQITLTFASLAAYLIRSKLEVESYIELHEGLGVFEAVRVL